MIITEGTEVFSIKEFAQFARTTRDTLLHYNKIGLLAPTSRGENNYRVYSGPQLGAVNLIRTFQKTGMPLSEVVDYKGNRSPEGAMEILERQYGAIDETIAEYRRTQKLMKTLLGIIGGVRGIDESVITTRLMPEERVVMGPVNDYSGGRNMNDALLSFYRACQEARPDMDTNYPVWGMFTEERIKAGDWRWPERFYFYNPEGEDVKPAGLYAIGYTRGGYGETDAIYRRMLTYIDGNGLDVCGPVFEEYPLNEIAVADPHAYLIRVAIMVRGKQQG